MALRKLQAEIDRTLKSVAQGVEVFESTFDKMNMSSSATQKDKLENDLKTQIKKLQRMRDQIKAWLGNGDIKDKTALLDNRKLIETQMERFKALEKEMKMKAFSKEGLIAQNKLDPAEKAKREMIDWVGNTTDELSRQIELTEAEAESLQNTRKKKQSGDRLGELEELNERRQWHIGRLEVVQRMLENGQLQVEQVEDIQEDVKYFLEANNEEDFDFDQGIYDELNLQEEEDYVHDFGHLDDESHLDTASLVDATEISTPAPKTPAKEEPAPSSSVSKKNTPASKGASSSQNDDTPPSPVSTKKTPSRKTTLESKAASKAADPAPPVPPVPAPAPATAPAPTPKAALPPIRYAAAAAAAVAGSAPAASAPVPAQTDLSPQKPKEPLPAPTPSSLVDTPMEKAPSPAKVESPQAATPSPSKVNGAQANVSDAVLSSITQSSILFFSRHELTSLMKFQGHPPPPPPGLASSKSPLPSNQASIDAQTSAQPAQPPAPVGYAPQHAESSRAAAAQLPTPSQTPAQPGVMGNLMHSFEVAKEISKRRTNDVHELNTALDGSYSNIPQQTDAEPPRYYHPKHPVKTPSYYPQARIPIIEDKNLYPRLDLDQLFYIFYYMTGTYEQWLAAQELKRQSWRFHKQYLTWFQRAHNPQAITEDYEQGGYYYFDWENSWCQRRKSDFRFEVSHVDIRFASARIIVESLHW
ncbi:CCR4-NOT transcription complex subunit 3 [Kwoniella heveanensis CBS 569]|nr:CCR4-NOT transcription complex subunit 3 [Kwoniella heveanensis CBS 569]